MSFLAEFASSIHERYKVSNNRALNPVHCQGKFDRIDDIRVVLFDVYGTLVNSWRPEFASSSGRQEAASQAFQRVIDFFEIASFLEKIDPSAPPHKTLNDFYHGIVLLLIDKKRQSGAKYPEIKVEQAWNIIVQMLARHGFSAGKKYQDCQDELFRCMAYFYNHFMLGRGLFEGVVGALEALRRKNIILGIASNGQFYTPVDLTLFIRDQSNQFYQDYLELFDPDFIFFSHEYGVQKTGETFFRNVLNRLREYSVLPQQVLYIGNDLSSDVTRAESIGMRSGLFTGDCESTLVHDLEETVCPDITFTKWDALDEIIYGESSSGGGEAGFNKNTTPREKSSGK